MRVTLETVTPLFLGGADPGKAPELRPPSFRGALRFWWRALLGGVLGDDNLTRLREQEAAVFGEIEKSSPVTIRLTAQERLTAQDRPQPSGVRYLFWSMQRANRQYLPDGTTFTLILQTRPVTPSDEPLKGALISLWLLTRLGGIGSRARRGAGSVQVTSLEGNIPGGIPDLLVRAKTPQQLQDELANGLKQLRTLTTTVVAGPTSLGITPKFDVLDPKWCRIFVLSKIWDTWEQVLDEVGQKFQTFRSRRQPDYNNVKNVVSSKKTRTLPPVERAAFGLPIVFYYRSLDEQQAILEGDKHDRRASPLFMRVLRLANGQHTAVISFFQAALLESDEKLALRQGKNCLATAPVPEYSLVHAFLTDLDKTIPLLEVKRW